MRPVSTAKCCISEVSIRSTMIICRVVWCKRCSIACCGNCYSRDHWAPGLHVALQQNAALRSTLCYNSPTCYSKPGRVSPGDFNHFLSVCLCVRQCVCAQRTLQMRVQRTMRRRREGHARALLPPVCSL